MKICNNLICIIIIYTTTVKIKGKDDCTIIIRLLQFPACLQQIDHGRGLTITPYFVYVKLIGIIADACRDYTIVTKNNQEPEIQSAGAIIIIIIETAV